MGDGRGSPSVRTCSLFLVAFFCPPIAVLIARGEIDSYFWLNLLLTLLAWLPGVVHAMWVLLSRNPLSREQHGNRDSNICGCGDVLCCIASASWTGKVVVHP